jgi:N-acetylmuramic acid 6-phosphate etherase
MSLCAPTFNLATRTVQFIIAGGPKALGTPAESSEDDTKLGRDEMARRKPGKCAVVVGIASADALPSPWRQSNTRATAAQKPSPSRVTATHRWSARRLCHRPRRGPGDSCRSSRMKAGTAHKMVLNMISTGAMTRLGYV